MFIQEISFEIITNGGHLAQASMSYFILGIDIGPAIN